MVGKSSLFGKFFNKGEKKRSPGIRRTSIKEEATPVKKGNGKALDLAGERVIPNPKVIPIEETVKPIKKGLRSDIRAALDAAMSKKEERRIDPIKEIPRVESTPVPVKPPKAKPLKKEDAQRAMVDGIKDLSGLLRGIRTGMDNQGERTEKLIKNFQDLPEAAKAQIQFLERISAQMESQHSHTSELLERFSQIPELLAGVQKILESQQAAEERRDQTLGRFRDTMERINTSIAVLNKDTKEAINTNARSFERGHAESVRTFEKKHSESVQAFELSQRQTLDAFLKASHSQNEAMSSVLKGSTKQNRAILVFLILVFLVMSGALVAFLIGRL